VPGVAFAVWGSDAKRVSVVRQILKPLGRTLSPDAVARRLRIWELFVPALGEGEMYKYEIWDYRSLIRLKTTPTEPRSRRRPTTHQLSATRAVITGGRGVAGTTAGAGRPAGSSDFHL